MFSNVNSDDILPTAMQNFYGLIRQGSVGTRPVAGPEETRRDEATPQFPKLIEGHSSGPVKSEPSEYNGGANNTNKH